MGIAFLISEDEGDYFTRWTGSGGLLWTWELEGRGKKSIEES